MQFIVFRNAAASEAPRLSFLWMGRTWRAVMLQRSIATSTSHIAWCNGKLERRQTPAAGDGLFAYEPITRNELLVVWGGVIVTTEELYKLQEFPRNRSIQVEEDLHLCSGWIDDIADCVNHSCNPNAGLSGQVTLVAMRDICPGDEICFDYAMSDSHPQFYMPCNCGQPQCRGVVKSDDWKLITLQRRYKGYFSPYLQRRIDALRKTGNGYQRSQTSVRKRTGTGAD